MAQWTIPLALLLAGCSKDSPEREGRNAFLTRMGTESQSQSGSPTNTTTLFGPQPAPGPDSIRPGQWDMTTEMTSVEAPGAPEPFVQQLRAQLASQRQTQSQCVTAEQARNPSRTMTGQNPAGCQFSDTTWAGGNIRVRATCRPAGSPTVQMTLEGTYGAEQINSRIDMNMEMPNPTGAGGPIQIRIGGAMTGRRTGDCRS